MESGKREYKSVSALLKENSKDYVCTFPGEPLDGTTLAGVRQFLTPEQLSARGALVPGSNFSINLYCDVQNPVLLQLFPKAPVLFVRLRSQVPLSKTVFDLLFEARVRDWVSGSKSRASFTCPLADYELELHPYSNEDLPKTWDYAEGIATEPLPKLVHLGKLIEKSGRMTTL